MRRRTHLLSVAVFLGVALAGPASGSAQAAPSWACRASQLIVYNNGTPQPSGQVANRPNTPCRTDFRSAPVTSIPLTLLGIPIGKVETVDARSQTEFSGGAVAE